jgi:hypothetical protein
MTSVLNPITTASASDCLAGFGLTINRTMQRQGSGDHEPFDEHRLKTISDTLFGNWLCHIGRTTEGKLDDLPWSVKRLSGFLVLSRFQAV